MTITAHAAPQKQVLDTDLMQEWSCVLRQLRLICDSEGDVKRRVESNRLARAVDCGDFHYLGQGAVLPAEPASCAVTWRTKTRPPNDIGIIVGVHINKHDVAHIDAGAGPAGKRESIVALHGIGGKIGRRALAAV